MNWIFIAMLAPFLFAMSTFIDKFLISKYFKSSSRALVVYSGVIAIPAFILVFIFKPSVIDIGLPIGLLIIVNSFLIVGYLFPFYAALRKADASSVIPLFSMIPILNYILAFFVLKETLTPLQMAASLLIIIGALGISLNLKKKFQFTGSVFGFMLLASLLISINAIVFKFFAIDYDFWTVSFWQYLGFFIFSALLLGFSRGIRKDFIDSFRKNKWAIIGLNAVNETINIVAIIISIYAILLAPVALVSSINGLGPVFVFLIGLLLTLFLPKLIKEDLSLRVIVQKIIAIIIIFIGGYILHSTFAG